MLEYYSNRLCIPAKELVERGLMSNESYKKMATRGKFDVVRNARGLGNYALVAVDSLPQVYKTQVREIYPDQEKVRLLGWLRSNYEHDQAAAAFFLDQGSCGVELSQEKAKEYTVNASVLNECIRLYENAKAVRKTMGEKYNWSQMTQAVELLREEYGHTLPASVLRFRKKVTQYKREGYGCLISGKFGNQNTRKVDFKTEQLVLSIAVLPNKPFNTHVHEMYLSFVCGELDVYDIDTGELCNPDGFTDKNGDPKSLSESTINNILNSPANKLRIEHKLSSWTTFMHEQAPHVHRHLPEFSLSKISFDDRDLPRKLKDTKQRPKAYYAYDVATGCVVGVAYNRNKNVDLVVDCFRSMFRLLDRNGWGVPAQVEVENHLMSQWKDSFLKAGVLFPFVHFCAPQNSQEKYAEPMNGAKKKRIEHRNHLGVGRFYGKGKWRTESKKISDEQNDTYEDKQYYSWDELISEDANDVYEWNNTLHPNQKRYPGMTRWQVLAARINPALEPMKKSVLARFIGEHVETSIRRNSYCRVEYRDWWLSETKVLEKLAPNNMRVDAYYIPDEHGEYDEVYIYQNDRYIDTLEYIGTFNTADAEQTDEDREIFTAQQKKIAAFRKYVNDNEITSVGVQEQEAVLAEAITGEEHLDLPASDIPDETDDVRLDTEDYGARALMDY